MRRLADAAQAETPAPTLRFTRIVDRAPTPDPVSEAVQVEINDRRGVERDELREQQAADNRDAQRAAQFGAGALLQRQRQRAEQRRHRGHHDGAEPQQARLVNGFLRRQAFRALGVQREVDHHDGVLLHDADEQDDADQRNQREVVAGRPSAPAARPRPPRAGSTES